MHYTTVFAGVMFATSGLAVPFDSKSLPLPPSKRQIDLPLFPNVTNVTTVANVTSSVNITSVANVTDVTTIDVPVSVAVVPAKRQLDLSLFSSLLSGLLGSPSVSITSLLPTVISSLGGIGTTFDGLLQGTGTSDLGSILSNVVSILNEIIEELENLISGGGVDLSSDTSQAALANAIAEAEALLTKTQNLSGVLGSTDKLGEVQSLATTVIALLTGLA
ncbi:hypothetical protein PV04_07692 [Phialophora macrospora]|uniref:Uncharacterized protein n=1 Tax=Phialophora macrospora TaxID=1851006 RepID=A0A0D2CJL6_9EURO|nr:hypothetical protein PV04_07692 [Phialophora macrospora]